MSTPVNPTDILFSVTSNEDVLESTLSPPQNIYVTQDDIVEPVSKKKTNTSAFSSEAFVPSKDKNVLLPYFPDNPVIETTSFKAYLILVEENIFLQNEAANGRSPRRNRALRRNLLGMTASSTNDTDAPAVDTNPHHSLFESAFDNRHHNHSRSSEPDTEDSLEETVSGLVETDNVDLTPAILRGILLFRVLKQNTKIKNINLNLKGDSRTNWPEGIPPKKTEFLEIENIVNYDWKFFNIAAHDDPRYKKGGANHINTLPEHVVKKEGDLLDIDNLDLNDTGNSNTASSFFSSISAVTSNSSQKSSKKSKLFGLSKPKSVINQFSSKSNVFSKASSSNTANSRKSLDTTVKPSESDDSYFDSSGNYIFQPGDYIYNFEQTIPQSSPESLNLTFGFVNYWLNLEVVRAGKFKSTLRAKKKINLIRTNSSQSIEENYEPIMINKSWEDRLSYSILIASNFVILNSFIPINIRLVPTDKNVKLYKIRIFLVEILEYWCKERKVHRLEPQRKFLLLEHKPKVGTNLLKDFEDINFNNSVITDKTGSDKRPDQVSSVNTNEHVAGASNSAAVNSAERLLPHILRPGNETNAKTGDKKKRKSKRVMPEDDEEEYISSKDFNYQLYVPEMFSKFSSKLHPDAKHKNIECHHWIKISLRLSKKVDDFEVLKESVSDANNEYTRALDLGALSDTSDPGMPSAAHTPNGTATRRSSFANPLPKKKQGNQTPEEKPKRKHYEISIDSPIALLHPLCTQANTLLPAYDGTGPYDPYTYARRKSNGQVEILTNNNPLFPPEILGMESSPTEPVIATKGSEDGVHIVNPMDAYKGGPARPPLNEAVDNELEDKIVPTGDDYTALDHEFQAEVTPQMISANLYQPKAIDLDLTVAQAMPMNPKPIALLPVASNRVSDKIDNLLSPNLDTLQVSPANTTQLSPNFRALSPALQALTPALSAKSPGLKPLDFPLLTSAISGTNHYASSVLSKERTEMHLLHKPPIKPPTYNQTLGIEPTIDNTILNNSIMQSAEQLVRAPPPPSYEEVVREKSQLKTLRRFQNAPLDDVDIDIVSDPGDDNENDVAHHFSFTNEDPNVPRIVTAAGSPRITASSLTGFLSSSNAEASSSARLLDANTSSISTGLLNEENLISNEIKMLDEPVNGSYGDDSSASSLTQLPELMNKADKSPLLHSDGDNNSSHSLIKHFPSRTSTSNRLNASITSLWNPVKNYNVAGKSQNKPLDADIFHNFVDDSQNDLGLQ